MMWATGDMQKWMVMTRQEAIGGWYTNEKRHIVASSIGATDAAMYRRQSVYTTYDPLISLTDYSLAVSQGNILYCEGSHVDAPYIEPLNNHNGIDVYIR